MILVFESVPESVHSCLWKPNRYHSMIKLNIFLQWNWLLTHHKYMNTILAHICCHIIDHRLSLKWVHTKRFRWSILWDSLLAPDIYCVRSQISIPAVHLKAPTAKHNTIGEWWVKSTCSLSHRLLHLTASTAPHSHHNGSRACRHIRWETYRKGPTAAQREPCLTQTGLSGWESKTRTSQNVEWLNTIFETGLLSKPNYIFDIHLAVHDSEIFKTASVNLHRIYHKFMDHDD